MTPNDIFNLERYVTAQSPVYINVVRELKAGCKRTHWMWFIFPQVSGLGRSSRSKFYAIDSKEQAFAYLHHPILGKRLIECAQILLDVQDKSANEIFNSPDDMKLRSSMTLFASISDPASVFEKVLKKYFAGQVCMKTIDFIRKG